MADSDDTTTPGKSPAFQFYPKDFTSGTLTLSTEEVGAYILLMCHCWDKGSVPANLTLMARIARLSPAKMRKAWDALSAKFRATDAGYIQPRIERERQKQDEYRRRQSDASKKRWDSRGNAKPLPTDKPNGSSPVSDLQSPSPVRTFRVTPR